MIHEVILPQLDANMEEGTLLDWKVAPGDRVERSQALVELQTDKAVFDIESPASGVLVELLAPSRSVLPPGYILALINGHEDELVWLPEMVGTYEAQNKQLLLQNDPFAGLATPSNVAKHTSSPTASSRKAPRLRATPAARRLAQEKGLDLQIIKDAIGCEVINEGAIHEYCTGLERE